MRRVEKFAAVMSGVAAYELSVMVGWMRGKDLLECLVSGFIIAGLAVCASVIVTDTLAENERREKAAEAARKRRLKGASCPRVGREKFYMIDDQGRKIAG